jgi:hypothetical protein
VYYYADLVDTILALDRLKHVAGLNGLIGLTLLSVLKTEVYI